MKLSDEPKSVASRAVYPVVLLVITALMIALGFQNCMPSKVVKLQSGVTVAAGAESSLPTFNLFPASSAIALNDTQQISAQNAPASSVFVLVSGEGSVDPITGLYTAPNAETIAVIGLALDGVVLAGSQSTVNVSSENEDSNLTGESGNASGSASGDASGGADESSNLSLPANVNVAIGKSAILTATGGQPPITYSVAPVNEGNGFIDSASGNFSGLAAGDVSVTATDSAGHTATTAVTVIEIQYCVLANEGESANVQCPGTSKIKSLDFASFGTPSGGAVGECTGTPFSASDSCNATSSVSVVESTCANGSAGCTVEANTTTFSGDPCEGATKQLAIQVTCF